MSMYVRAYIISAIVIIVFSLFLIYRNSLINQGKVECQANIERAIKQQQEIANENSFIYEAYRQKVNVEYKTKIKEVEKLVPSNHSCDLPISTIRMLNNTIKGE